MKLQVELIANQWSSATGLSDMTIRARYVGVLREEKCKITA